MARHKVSEGLSYSIVNKKTRRKIGTSTSDPGKALQKLEEAKKKYPEKKPWLIVEGGKAFERRRS